MPNCRHVCLSLLIFNLLGCSIFQEEPAGPDESRAMRAPGAQSSVWLGPKREVSHYRTLFHGYDTVNYRLAAWESGDPEQPFTFRLLIDAHYGGARPRHYDLAKWADGSSRATTGHKHEAERCQLFNSMVSACLFHDRAWLELSRDELEDARTAGLTLTLASEAETYERIAIPAADIQSLLDAAAPAR